MPPLNADLNFSNEISEEIDVSSIQMMKGINTNMMTPLARCRMDTQAAGGMR